VGICKQITFLILHKVTSRLVTLLKFIYSPIQVSNILVPTIRAANRKSQRLISTPTYWLALLSIVQYSEEHLQTQRFGDLICFRPQMFTLLGPIERAETSITGQVLCSVEYHTMDKA
jgi:hypothetical protein